MNVSAVMPTPHSSLFLLPFRKILAAMLADNRPCLDFRTERTLLYEVFLVNQRNPIFYLPGNGFIGEQPISQGFHGIQIAQLSD